MIDLSYYTRVYACPACEKETGYAHIYEHKAPPPLLKHSLASPSTVADVMVQKYVDGIPLARQEKIWKRNGIALTRGTLGNWVNEIYLAQRTPTLSAPVSFLMIR